MQSDFAEPLTTCRRKALSDTGLTALRRGAR